MVYDVKKADPSIVKRNKGKNFISQLFKSGSTVLLSRLDGLCLLLTITIKMTKLFSLTLCSWILVMRRSDAS